MKLIERYPTVAMFLSFFISSCVFAYLGMTVKAAVICCAVFLILLLLVLSFLKCRHNLSRALRRGLTMMLAACAVAASISLYSFDIRVPKIMENIGRTDMVVLEVKECKYSLSYASGYVVTVKESLLLDGGTKLLLTTELGYLEEGAILSGEVVYSSVQSASSAVYDSSRYYLAKRIMLNAEDSSLSVVGVDESFSLERVFHKLNRRLASMLVSHCGYEAGGFASAVLLGNKGYLSDSLERDFGRLGITHLLVVSGTHFSVIIALLESAFKKTRLRRKTRAMINIAVILFIMGITGFSASVTRAGIMHLLAQLSFILFKRANMVNSFAVAGTLLVLLNPYATLDCGLQLSFIATYSCIMFQLLKGSFYRDLREKHGIKLTGGSRLKRFFVSCGETVVLTTLITLCSMPLIWLYFGEISLISIPANVIFIPLITLFMYLVCAYLILYPLVLPIAPLAVCIRLFTDGLGWLGEHLGSGRWVMLSVDYPFSAYFLIPVAALLIILPLVGKRSRAMLLLSSLTLCVAFFGTVYVTEAVDRGNVRLSYVNIGKNDGLVIKADGKALIADISDASYGFSSWLTGEAQDMHVCEIEYLLLTHYHNKHIGLLTRISESEMLRCVILPEPIDEREEDIYSSLAEMAQEKGITMLTLPVGGSFVFGDAVITLGDRVYLSRSTHPVTSLLLEVGDESAVYLSGSFNEAGEAVTSLATDADTVILGAHSPVYKKTFGISFVSDPKAMVVSYDAYMHMDEEMKEYTDSHPSHTVIDTEITHRLVIKAGG